LEDPIKYGDGWVLHSQPVLQDIAEAVKMADKVLREARAAIQQGTYTPEVIAKLAGEQPGAPEPERIVCEACEGAGCGACNDGYVYFEPADPAPAGEEPGAPAKRPTNPICRGCGKELAMGFHDCEPYTCNYCGANNDPHR